MIRFKLFFFFLALAPALSIQGQDSLVRPYQIGFRSGIGFITNHNPTMLYYTNQHVLHQEWTFEKKNHANKQWEGEFKRSNYGIAFSYFSFNRDILGEAVSLFPYLNFNILGKGKLQWKFRTAIGLGYFSKPFDENKNYKNSAIGSHANLYFSFLTELRWQFSQRLASSLAADFSHFSNTSFKKPNLGINIPSINLGLSYQLGKRIVVEQKPKEKFMPKDMEVYLSGGFGLAEIYPANGEKFLTKYLAVHAVKRMNGKSSLGIGLDAFHNPAIYEELRRDTLPASKGWGSSQVGIAIDHFLHLGHFSMGNHLGYYLKNENVFYTKSYFGVSGNYSISPKVQVFLNLKTHRAKAEYLIMGLRYRVYE